MNRQLAQTLEIHNLSKGFSGQPVLQNIDLRVDSGQVFGVLGVNGAGKTTLIRLITGILQPDTGSVTVLGTATVTGSSPAAAATSSSCAYSRSAWLAAPLSARGRGSALSLSR